jgi:excisionase family DNA binding protein
MVKRRALAVGLDGAFAGHSLRAGGRTTYDPLLTVPQVAQRLNTSERYVRRLIDERRVEFARVGRKYGWVRLFWSDGRSLIQSCR